MTENRKPVPTTSGDGLAAKEEKKLQGPPFATTGEIVDHIGVRISYRIIKHFSEGLYSSPHKAIEELVSNAFDAGALNVHVLLSPSLSDKDSTIAVIDDGQGMDTTGLKQHWVIGESDKRNEGYKSPRGRQQIGQFGIGKLATYVLATRLTHITKASEGYWCVSMNYDKVPTVSEDPDESDVMTLDLRKLTEEEARTALEPWIDGDKPGYAALKLFGDDAHESWTAAIMSGLKEMATEITRGRLEWVLATAMPVRGDMALYLDGSRVIPSKEKGKKIKSFVLGKNLKDLPKPASKEWQITEDATVDKDSPFRYGLTHPTLGRVTGKGELFVDRLDTGKSEITGRSNGFFVYVKERLINLDDSHFGIPSNQLRHGTFSRFRLEIHIDKLDEQLRSSRESVAHTTLYNEAKNLLQGIFNWARSIHEKYEAESTPGAHAAARVAATPDNLIYRPVARLVMRALRGEVSPFYTTVPSGLTEEQIGKLKEALEERARSDKGMVSDIMLTPLSYAQSFAQYDAETGVVQINTQHPFVAYFSDEYSNASTNLPLELLAVSEIALEAHLHDLGFAVDAIHALLQRRDDMLRELAKSTGKRNSLLVAQDLENAKTNPSLLQEELVAAFDSMGFNAIPIHKQGTPDGTAEAVLAAGADGARRSYKISLEAKSKEKEKGKVAAKTIGAATIIKHADRWQCDHSVVVAPEFPTTKGIDSAIFQEIQTVLDNEKRKTTGKICKTVTLIRVDDLAKLVRNASVRRLTLNKLRDLFQTCTLPEEAAAWIAAIIAQPVENPPYDKILKAIEVEQKRKAEEGPVSYANLGPVLHAKFQVSMTEKEIKGHCEALSRMLGGNYVYASKETVELNTSPQKIVDAISSMMRNTLTSALEEEEEQ